MSREIQFMLESDHSSEEPPVKIRIKRRDRLVICWGCKKAKDILILRKGDSSDFVMWCPCGHVELVEAPRRG